MEYVSELRVLDKAINNEQLTDVETKALLLSLYERVDDQLHSVYVDLLEKLTGYSKLNLEKEIELGR